MKLFVNGSHLDSEGEVDQGFYRRGDSERKVTAHDKTAINQTAQRFVLARRL
jgi:hypothetical protein